MGGVYVDAQYGGGPGYEHCILGCVLRENGEKEYILPVSNASGRGLSIREDDRVVRAQWCSPEDTSAVAEILSNKEVQRSQIDVSELNVDTSVTPGEVQELAELKNEHRNCIAQSMCVVGCTPRAEMQIDLITDNAITYRPYRLAHSEKEVVQGTVRELEEAGIVRESNSDSASPVLLL